MPPKYIGGSGSTNPKLFVVAEAPAQKEEELGIPLVGPTGQLFNSILKDCGIDRSEVYCTNAVKYRLDLTNEKLRKGPIQDQCNHIGVNWDDCLNDLRHEIRGFNPNCILALGNHALYALTGKRGKNNNIGVWRGSILSGMESKKVVGAWHPARFLRAEPGEEAFQPWEKYVMMADVMRAVEQSQFPELMLPVRTLEIANSFGDVYHFLERYKDEEYLDIDIESIEGIPICIGIAFTTTHGLSVPLWNIVPVERINKLKPKSSFTYSLEVSSIPTQELGMIWVLLAQLLLNPRYKKIGQNFKYDAVKLANLGFFIDKLHADTMIYQHTLFSELPKNQGFLTSIHTLEPYYKYEGRQFNPQKDKIKDFLLYNCKDVCTNLEIFLVQENDAKNIEHSMDHFYNFRMKLHDLYKHIDSTGLLIDKDAKKELIHKYVTQQVNLEKELATITNQSINIGSHKQVNILLYETLKLPRRKGTDETTLTALLANTVKKTEHKRILQIILDWRKNDRTINHGLKPRPDFDGRMRTHFFITGTENFRTSTGILDSPVRPIDIGISFHGITKHGNIGQDLRRQYIADKGYIFLNIDQSQAEGRVVANLCNDIETLKGYDIRDVHALTASWAFGKNEAAWSKKVLGYECPERFIGKTVRHAGHLDIQKRELMSNINTDAKKYEIKMEPISEWKAGQILEVFHNNAPKVRSNFHTGIQDLLAFNRRIYGTRGASRYFYGDWGRDLFKEGYAFIPQQTVSDTTKTAALQILANMGDVRIASEAHDALLLLVPEVKLDDYVPELRNYFEEPIDFSLCSFKKLAIDRLIIPCDFEIGYNYMDLRKYKK